ncbi:MAG: PKD domain-containing protein [Bacteroidota bacterium]
MRKFYLLTLALLWLGALTAQISLDADDVPAIGDSFQFSVDTFPTAIGNVGSAGADVTWDFSAANSEEVRVESYFDPSTGPNNEDFPNANLLIAIGGSTNYAEVTDEAVFFLGNAIDALDNGDLVSAVLEPTQTFFQIPTSFDDTYSDVYAFTVTVDGETFGVDSIRIEFTGNDEVEVDSWGTIVTPDGSFDCLRRKIDRSSVTKVYIKAIGIWTLFQTTEDAETIYQWLAPEAKGILATAEINENGLLTEFSFAQINNPLALPQAQFASNDVGNAVVDFTDQTTNTPTGWEWDFGDGNMSTEQNPNHTYTESGEYLVCLTASNSLGSSTFCSTLLVYLSPTASFTFNDLGSGDIDFMDASSNLPTVWEWDFGDGGSSNEQNPNYVYDAPGTYTVCLTVGNPDGENTYCEDLIIVFPPEAAFDFLELGDGGVAFTDVSSFEPTVWEWDFGDGGSSNEQNPEHVFETTGTYNVCLTASNDAGENTYCEELSFIGSSVWESQMLPKVEMVPNPAEDMVNLTMLDKEPAWLMVFDPTGSQVLQEYAGGDWTLEVSEWTPGLYFVWVRNLNGKIIYKEGLVVR